MRAPRGPADRVRRLRLRPGGYSCWTRTARSIPLVPKATPTMPDLIHAPVLDLPAAVPDQPAPALVRLRRFADLHAMPLSCPVAACRRSGRCRGPATSVDGFVPRCLATEMERLAVSASELDGFHDAVTALLDEEAR